MKLLILSLIIGSLAFVGADLAMAKTEKVQTKSPVVMHKKDVKSDVKKKVVHHHKVHGKVHHKVKCVEKGKEVK